MAEETRPPPHERKSGLPRRVPGAGGLTPGQVRRGFLPGRTPEAGKPAPTQGGTPAGPTEPARPQPGSSSPRGSLPRRSPGASAIQSPPPSTRRPIRRSTAHEPASVDRPAPSATDNGAPSPASLASSASSLLRARSAAEIATAARPAGRPPLPTGHALHRPRQRHRPAAPPVCRLDRPLRREARPGRRGATGPRPPGPVRRKPGRTAGRTQDRETSQALAASGRPRASRSSS